MGKGKVRRLLQRLRLRRAAGEGASESDGDGDGDGATEAWGSGAGEPFPAVLPARVSGDQAFALALYGQLVRQLAATRGNLCCSPASIRMALAMAYAGARGQTATQIADVLRLAPGDAAHDELAAQLAAWNAPAGEAPGPLRMANRLWTQHASSFVEAFLVRLADSYRAPLGSLDFARAPELSREAINRWVSDETAGKITGLLAPGTITAATRLVLTNAIVFLGRWVEPFEPELTRPRPFHVAPGRAVDVPMMYQTADVLYHAFPGGCIVELAYRDSDLVMDVMLPSERGALPALEAALRAGALDGWFEGLVPETVQIYLPRFAISAGFELADELRALGMTDAFTWPGADFSGIDGGTELVISSVVHRAEVRVDEAGTEAAAATAVVVRAGAGASRRAPPVFLADHPFVFVIRDGRTGAIVFIGRVTDPR